MNSDDENYQLLRGDSITKIMLFDKLKIIYNDPRRFGFFKIIENNEKLKHFFKNYGPEPFDKKFNLQYLKKSLKNKTKNIKNYLLDQKFVSWYWKYLC